LFILIPLLIILFALIGIGVIVYKKIPFLQKLTPESHEVGETVFHDFFPEVVTAHKSFNFKEYKEKSLRELEKILRRMKLVVSSIERWSESLIQRVRKVHRKTALEVKKAEEQVAEDNSIAIAQQDLVDIRPKTKDMSDDELRAEEQRLIVEIAKDPKNSMLYEDLGNVYVKLRSFQDAKDSFEAAFKLDPENQKLEKKLSNVVSKLPDDKDII
jgi:tetratricopeptide (TPR) repeat protein